MNLLNLLNLLLVRKYTGVGHNVCEVTMDFYDLESAGALFVLGNSRDLIEQGWCRGADARDKDGKEVGPTEAEAKQFCLVGSILRYSSTWGERVGIALRMLHAAMCYYYPWMGEVNADSDKAKADTLREWNDGTAQNVKDVLRLFDLARGLDVSAFYSRGIRW